MSDLKGTKNIDFMYFSACNTANPDVVNIAEAFFNYNPQINIVGGWDGGVAFVRNYFSLPDYADKPTNARSNPTFDYFAEKNKKGLFKRRRMGYVELSREIYNGRIDL